MTLTQRICQLLMDREWHSLRSLMPFLRPHMNAAAAARAFLQAYPNDGRRKRAAKLLAEERETRGYFVLARRAASSLRRHQTVESRGTAAEVQYRLTRWYCCSCGIVLRGKAARPPHGLCPACIDRIPKKNLR